MTCNYYRAVTPYFSRLLTKIMKDVIAVLSTMRTSHTPWILQEAGQPSTRNLYCADSKQGRRQPLVSMVNRLYKKEVLVLMLLAYVKREVITCHGPLTMHEVRVPDSKFGSSRPFRNLVTGLTITSGHLDVAL